MAISKENKAKLEQVGARIQAALETIGDDSGYTFKLGTMRVDPVTGSFTAKIEAGAKGAPTKAEMRYMVFQESFGLPDLGTVVVLLGTSYKLVGMNESNTKIYAEKDGKVFIVPIAMVQAHLKK